MKKVPKAVAVVVIFVTGIAAGLLMRPPGRYQPSASRVASFVKPNSTLVIKDAVLTRALGIEDPKRILLVLDRMPRGILSRDANFVRARIALWSLFFKGTMTKLGRLSSTEPLILYLNPIQDVGVILSCHYNPNTGIPRCNRACAFPGELLQSLQPTRAPMWLSEQHPFAALEREGDLQVAAFARLEPINEAAPDAWRQRFCSATSQALAERRLMDAAAAITHLNAHKVQEAIARYLADYKPGSASGELGAQQAADTTLRVLLNLPDYSVSGGLPLSRGNWLVFLTPRVNGWADAAIILYRARSGLLTIHGSRFFVFNTHRS